MGMGVVEVAMEEGMDINLRFSKLNLTQFKEDMDTNLIELILKCKPSLLYDVQWSIINKVYHLSDARCLTFQFE